MSVRLYVKLPKAEIEKEGFEKMFVEFGTSFTSKLIKERKKCRGFGFVTVPNEDAAEEFIGKYNEQTFIYNGEPFKDEEGNDFKLIIEKALPRSKGQTKEQEENKSKSEENTSTSGSSRRNSTKRSKKGRNSATHGKPTSVAESIQPDPRWAAELTKLKEMFAAQTTNS